LIHAHASTPTISHAYIHRHMYVNKYGSNNDMAAGFLVSYELTQKQQQFPTVLSSCLA